MSVDEMTALSAKAQAQQSLSYVRVYVYEIHMNPTFMLLSPEQRAEVVGVYLLALLMCMVVGYLPEDAPSLARLLNVSEKVVQRTWPLLVSHFVSMDGKVVHPRIRNERLEILRISEARKRVAKKRWERGFEGEDASGDAIAAQLDSEREVDIKSKIKTTNSKRPIDYRSDRHIKDGVATQLVESWNQMMRSTGGVLAEASVSDLPQTDLDRIVEGLGGLERVKEAIERIALLPFYRGQGPNGWKASLPWLLQRKSLASLLAQTPPPKGHPAADSTDLSDADRSLLSQLRESASADVEGGRDGQ